MCNKKLSSPSNDCKNPQVHCTKQYKIVLIISPTPQLPICRADHPTNYQNHYTISVRKNQIENQKKGQQTNEKEQEILFHLRILQEQQFPNAMSAVIMVLPIKK